MYASRPSKDISSGVELVPSITISSTGGSITLTAVGQRNGFVVYDRNERIEEGAIR